MKPRIPSLSQSNSSAAVRAVLSPLASALFAMLLAMLPVLVATPAAAFYPPDGLKPNPSGGYMNPDDGMCVIGVAVDGTMLVDWSITNARDCVAYTRSTDGSVDLVGLNTQDKCTKAGFAGNDGYKHAWSTSLCYDSANNRAISRVDLDNTEAMCIAKGGSIVTGGKCIAYGWVYRNRLPDGSLPVSGTGIGTTDGVQFSDGLGFCYAQMRMTSATYNSTTTCPSLHNSAATAPSGEWPACLSNASGCQTQESYDTGLGWTYASSQCLYAYGVAGYLNAAAVKADGTNTAAAGDLVDLTGITNQGDCLAAGYSWDNWLPNVSTIVEDNTGDFPGMPAGSKIRRLDALSSIEDGGGDFYSGTGAVCTKCHTDQSRSYQERNKPGFYKTRHRNAGDAIGEPFQPFFTSANSDWGLQGVQCAMCHSTAKPAQDDLIQVNPAGAPNAGNPKYASGHNNTEYGSHLVGICYTCHGTAADPVSVNPASVIPAAGGELQLTDKGLAPIANMFLNSPHAQYSGTSAKVDVGNKSFYNSHFNGYVCRTGMGKLSSTTYPNSGACTAAGYTWYTTTGQGNFCYYNQAKCLAFPQPAIWSTTFDPAVYPWASAPGGPGGVCAAVGQGSILTTYYRNDEAHRIENVNSSINEECTNAATANSPTSGAAGFWVRDGEASPGTPSDTSQGTCMTCHDVHWALADESPEAEPLRRECTTCHEKNLGLMKHPTGGGTPLEAMDTEPAESCETCHMPNKMHLFRVSSSASYSTFPPVSAGDSQLNTMADGSYANASWVDVDLACGQCHGGGAAHAVTTGGIASGSNVLTVDSATGLAADQRIQVAGAGESGEDLVSRIASVVGTTVTLTDEAATEVVGAAVEQNPVRNGAAYIAKAKLARRAKGIHNDAPEIRFGYTFSSPNTLTINVNASRTMCSGGSCDRYSWNFGDGGTASGVTASHTYAAAGTYAITLTVAEYGVSEASRTKNVAVTAPDYGPTAAGSCDFDANTWTLSITDASTDDHAVVKETVNWGDGSMLSVDESSPFDSFSHTFVTPGTYTVTQRVTDSIGQSSQRTCTVSPAAFTLGGTVYRSDGSTPVPSATVQLKVGGVVKRTVFTNSVGAYNVANLKPGTYTVSVSKSGFTFGNAEPSIPVGPSSSGNNIQATVP